MDGVFINLTNVDVVITFRSKEITIKANPDLITPCRTFSVGKESKITGIVANPDIDIIASDINYTEQLRSKWLFTPVYKNIHEESNVIIDIPIVSTYIKYPFTKEQISKINEIANGRMRLLILSKEDVEFWSCGLFECPFRHYRLFTWNNELESLVEYPVPKTYLDKVSTVVDSAFSASKKIIGNQ